MASRKTVDPGCLFKRQLLLFRLNEVHLVLSSMVVRHGRKCMSMRRLLPLHRKEHLLTGLRMMGCCGILLHASAVTHHALVIPGTPVSEHWVHQFCSYHPDLKAKWTTGLEKCHAQSLNPAAVSRFYDVLESLVKEYQITEENIYNMDKKGVQLGIGGHIHALLDWDQKLVNQVEDGDHELSIIIECVCADGTVIQLSAIFKSACQNLEWGCNNPCNAR